MKNALKI